jgi:SAM-dependent methyltransferase
MSGPPTDPVQVQLFQAELKNLPAPISALLSTYSGVPVEQQKEHITRVRNQAYKSHPYPCLGRWRFLELDLSNHPLYQSDILPQLQDTNTPDWLFLDLGCCLGQDVRKLVFDGADASRVYGADLRPEFIDMGYELFRDEDRFRRDAHFLAPADVFDFSRDSDLSKKCDGKVGILHTTAVFHLFDRDQQVKMAKRCLQLLDPSRGRALVCGSQVGNVDPGERARRWGGGSRYRHNNESWKELWEEVVQSEVWQDRIKAIEVHSTLDTRYREHELGKLRDHALAENEAAENALNNGQRQIGLIEEGFRWQKWWVWIDFV